MTWYAVRTVPGAQKPKREYWGEPNKSALAGKARGRGYRIVNSLNPQQSAVELALEKGGFTYYMPVEYDAVRNRKKKQLYEVRRFAMCPGYLFVGDIRDEDWPRLMETPGVQGVIGVNYTPQPIPAIDLFRLRMFEARSKDEAETAVKKANAHIEREERRARKNAFKSMRRKLFAGKRVRLLWGDKVGREAVVSAWADEEKVRVILDTIKAQETITVPYEYLRALDEQGLTGTDA